MHNKDTITKTTSEELFFQALASEETILAINGFEED